MTKRCIIVGAGEWDGSALPVREGDYVIAADGGYARCKRLGIEPDLVLGDFDSLEADGREALRRLRQEKPEKIRTLPAQKDDTDMLAAIREGLALNCREFLIYGGLGGRLSHTAANLQCLNFLENQGAKGYLVGERVLITLVSQETVTFPAQWMGYVSVFCFGERAEGVTIRNMKYLLDGAALTNDFPIGVSNEFIGKEGSITVEKGTLLIVAEISDVPASFPGGARFERSQSAGKKW